MRATKLRLRTFMADLSVTSAVRIRAVDLRFWINVWIRKVYAAGVVLVFGFLKSGQGGRLGPQALFC